MSYGHDAVGNRLWVKNKNGRGDVYQYDADYQVTGVKYNVANPQDGFAAATNATREVSYALDAVGNRTNVVDNLTSTAYTINNLNQYTAVGSTNFTYDTRGNLTGDGTWMYSYDLENHLIGANKSGVSAQYLYDSFGRRISKTVNGVKRVYVYSGENLIEERDATGVLLANYVYEGLDVPVKAMIGGVTYYPHQDALGNVMALTTAAGVIAEQYEYDIYGKVTVKNGAGIVISTPPLIPFLFTGRELDNETGLYHYRARAYSTNLGRFLQADPIDFDGGDVNLYRYCNNDPINNIDPSGLVVICGPWRYESAGITYSGDLPSELISERTWQISSREIRGASFLPPGSAKAFSLGFSRRWGGFPMVKNVLRIETWRERVWQLYKLETYTTKFYRPCIDTCEGHAWIEHMSNSKTGKYGRGTKTERERIKIDFL